MRNGSPGAAVWIIDNHLQTNTINVMKRSLTTLLLSVFAVTALLSACQNDDSPEQNGKGAIALKASVDNKTALGQIETRAGKPLTDFTGYKLVLSGTAGQTMDFPSDSKVTGLDPGPYTIKVTNYPEDYTPSFGDPRYDGSSEVTVKSGETASVAVELTQANAGVYFVYHESLAQAGIGDIVPTATQGTNSLVYEGANKEAKGYFAPGTVAISVKNGGNVIKIGDLDSKDLTVKREQLWEVTLKASTGQNEGGVSISATIVEITNPTNQEDWSLTPPKVYDIPDMIFKMWLIGKSYITMDFESGKVLSVDESVKKIYIEDFEDWPGIKSLKGLEYFPNLEYLEYRPYPYEAEDSVLEYVDVTQNPNLKHINIGNNLKLNKLDLSQNPLLEVVYAYNTAITELNVANRPYLRIMHCYETEMTEVDLTGCPELVVVRCNDTKVNKLLIPDSYKVIDIHMQYSEISELEVTQIPTLNRVDFAGTKLTKLDFSGLKKLAEANCADMPGITDINISGCDKLQNFFFTNKLGNKYNIMAGGTLDITNMSGTIPVKTFIADNIGTNPDLGDNYWVKKVICDGSDHIEMISLQNCQGVTEITAVNNPKLSKLYLNGNTLSNITITQSGNAAANIVDMNPRP